MRQQYSRCRPGPQTKFSRCRPEPQAKDLLLFSRCRPEPQAKDLLLFSRCRPEPQAKDLLLFSRCRPEPQAKDLLLSSRCRPEPQAKDLLLFSRCRPEPQAKDLLFRSPLFAALLWVAGAAGCSHPASQSPQPSASRWFATWTASASDAGLRPPRDSVDRIPTLYDQTVRMIIRTSIGGDNVRIRLSNEYGDKPLVIGTAHIAVRTTGSSVDATTDRTMTFNGSSSVRLRPGAIVFSDPVAFNVPALRDLAISLHVTDSARLATRHALAVQTNYLARGNLAGAASLVSETSIYVWPFLVGVDVTNNAATGVIVAIGNSITDGALASRDSNTRWPNILAQRLLASGEPVKGVVNAGISGGRVLTYGAGPSALARFDRDVLMTPGLTHVILLEGINDIGRSAVDGVTADDIIAGYRQLIARAHDRGVSIIGATLTPASPRAPFTPALEAKRAAVNAFVRSSGEFDGVIDFDMVTRDPSNPLQFLPKYDSGDHLHPGDVGYRAMGEAIDLTLFRRRR